MISMMRILLLSLAFYSLTFKAAADDTPFGTVKELFAAMSALDGNRMHRTAVGSFELLEAGEVWNMAMLVDAVVTEEKGWQRHNYFALITSNISGEKAWVTYWNKAILNGSDGQNIIFIWLESAILVRQDGKWLIEMLHSTHLGKSQSLPDSIALVEHVDDENNSG